MVAKFYRLMALLVLSWFSCAPFNTFEIKKNPERYRFDTGKSGYEENTEFPGEQEDENPVIHKSGYENYNSYDTAEDDGDYSIDAKNSKIVYSTDNSRPDWDVIENQSEKKRDKNEKKCSLKSPENTLSNRGSYAGRSGYRVKKGDTLYGISKRFGCSIEELSRQNGIKSAGMIKTGMILKIPVSDAHESGLPAGRVHNKSGKSNGILFRWPLVYIGGVKKDDSDGVKSSGIIIAGKSGASVVSSANGVVKKIGEMRGFGKYVIISHDERFVSVYAGIKDICISLGERVASGRKIGKIDEKKNSINFQIGHQGKPVDPLLYLPKRI